MIWVYGKTLQAITLARYKKEHNGLKHCLIICGVNSLKWNWEREVSKFCKNEKAIVLGTRKTKRGTYTNITVEETKQQIDSVPEEFFWIINIERMRSSKTDTDSIPDHLNQLILNKELGMVIIDEVHKIKNSQSQQGIGILKLDGSASKMAMTGTLLVNNPQDLYAPMKLIGLINYNKWYFENQYMIKDDWGQIIGFKNMNELHNILYKSSLRRTKDLLTLPEKMYMQEWLELSKEEKNVFDQITGNETPFRLEKIEKPREIFAVITRMRQATVAAGLLTAAVKKSTKFDRLNDILEEAKSKGQKVLVFCPFTEALKLGLEYCREYNPKLICGGMGSKVQEIVDEHENTNGFSVIFAQEATLGVGYTLINTNIVVFLSPPWNEANYEQCSDRCYRIGQKNTVQVIDLLAKDTYDELLYQKLHGKGAISKMLIDGREDEAILKYMKEAGIIYNKDNTEDRGNLFGTLFDIPNNKF